MEHSYSIAKLSNCKPLGLRTGGKIAILQDTGIGKGDSAIQFHWFFQRCGWLFAAAGALLILLLGDYNCAIRRLTGVPCPGCGMTRAALCLLQLDFFGAWQLQPMIYLLIFYIVLLSLRSVAGRPMRNWLIFCGVSYCLLALLLWVFRFFAGTLPY